MPKWDVTFETRIHLTSPEVVTAVAKIDALAAVIRNIPIPPGVQDKIDALNILRAIRGTTGIEGIELSEEEVAKNHALSADEEGSASQSRAGRERSPQRRAGNAVRG